jgi:hypothetical protein
MLVPAGRALRLLLASDGLWDLVPVDKALKSIRSKLPHEVRARACARVFECVRVRVCVCSSASGRGMRGAEGWGGGRWRPGADGRGPQARPQQAAAGGHGIRV